LNSVKSLVTTHWLQFFWLLIWIVIGSILRLTNLTHKTIWSDEFSTIVFSLGNSFKTVPINEIISLETILQAIAPNPETTVKDTIYNLSTESTHPPLYFMLSHWWLKLFPSEGGLVSLWGARSLSAVFGVIAIPATFGLGWLTFNSLTAAQLSAALMAVSPFGVYLSQEARHYTLATLWIVGSLSCLIVTIKGFFTGRKISLALVFMWIIANVLGMATHYFFVISLVAEGLVLVGLKLKKLPKFENIHRVNWQRIYLVAFGTLAGCSIWIPVWQNLHARELTQWIASSNDPSFRLFEPIGQLLAAGLSMLLFLPVENVDRTIAITSSIVMFIIFIGTIYLAVSGFIRVEKRYKQFLQVRWLAAFVASAIAIFLFLTYANFSDLLSGLRYNFVYFPAFIVCLAGCLSFYWQFSNLRPKIKIIQPKLWIYLSGLMAITGALVVVLGLGFQKPDRPDLFLEKMMSISRSPILITTGYHQHGLAWEIQRQKLDESNYKFLLSNARCKPNLDRDCLPVEQVLEDRISRLQKPLDVWVINYPSLDINFRNNCQVRPGEKIRFPGFKAKLYHCSKS
jgi:uncharacterized membrane protein